LIKLTIKDSALDGRTVYRKFASIDVYSTDPHGSVSLDFVLLIHLPRWVIIVITITSNIILPKTRWPVVGVWRQLFSIAVWLLASFLELDFFGRFQAFSNGAEELFFVCQGYFLFTPILKHSYYMRAYFHIFNSIFNFLLITIVSNVNDWWESLLLKLLHINIGVPRCVMTYWRRVGSISILIFDLMSGWWFETGATLLLFYF